MLPVNLKHALPLILWSGVIGASAWGGYNVSAWKYGEKLAQQEANYAKALNLAKERAEEIAELQAQAIALAAEAEALRNQEAKIIERVITEEVIRYVQTDNGRACGLDADGVRLHDAAAAGRLPEAPDTPAEPDDATGAVTAGQVVSAVTGNYAICHSTANRLRALQDWARAISTHQEPNNE